MQLPQNDHNSKDNAGYEAAIKTVVSDKINGLSAREAEQVNWYIDCLLEASQQAKIEAEQGYGDWTDDELKIMSLMSLQRTYAEEDEGLISPQALHNE